MLGWAQRADRVATFLDVLLLASVVPAAYALQQRLEFDFYPLHELTRPGSTFGNPLFFAAYLGILLPLTAVRCWQARRRYAEFALWSTVAFLQVCGLLVTQSRGPLLATFLGLLMLACCAAGYARARRVFFAAACAFVLAVAALIAINTVSSARYWAQDVPVVRRLVFNLDRAAGAETQQASTSAAARLAIWGAGVETFSAAPLENKLFGYGPESAYMFYFPYMPASVMRLVGYGHYHTYDRMHADTLDIGLNFGLLAWLVYCVFFCAVMYAAARALWGLAGRAPLLAFLVFTGGGGALAALAAGQAGLASAAVPALGLGICTGVFLFMVACAWRALKRGIPASSIQQTGRWTLLAGLTSALWIFWIDAQVNIPVLTTRFISFGIAALILIVADGAVRTAVQEQVVPGSARNLWIWGVACVLVAACASCLPVVLLATDPGILEQIWPRRAVPILAFLPMIAFAAWALVRDSDSGGIKRSFNRREIRNVLTIALGLPLIFCVIHFALIVKPGAEIAFGDAQSIAIATCAAPIFIFGICFTYAVVATRSAVLLADAPVISRFARWSTGAVLALAVLVAAQDSRAVRADVAATFAIQNPVKPPPLVEQLFRESIQLIPYERFYRRQLIFQLLGRAVADIRRVREAPQRTPETPGLIDQIVQNLNAAEREARTGAQLFPRDPWMVGALANVLQIEGLRLLRPLDPEGGLRSAQEAHQIFAHTHSMFPNEPLFLRNWAQLLFDQGNMQEAYRLLDVMEKLVPNDLEPFAARIDISQQASDYKTISDTLARARLALEPAVFKQLLTVAKVQQH
jgi:hypothetical protein